MKRILVTGAGGFVGRHCLPDLLARGFDVHGTVPPRNSAPRFTGRISEGVAWHTVDLLDEFAVDCLLQRVRPSHLLHLAWITAPGDYWTSAKNFHWTSASLRLLWSFRDAGGYRVVMTGSCAEYDWQYGLCGEASTPLKPISVYGHAKHVLHQLVEQEAAESGLSTAWARLFFLYGPYASPNRLPGAVIEPLLRGDRAPCSNGACRRDYLYITDAAAALCALVAGDRVGPMNIASGTAIPLKDMIRRCGELVGRESLLEWGRHPGGNETPLIQADTRRVRSELSWSPKIDLDEGLRRTIEWFRSREGNHRAVA